jgi:hypothetical protein
MKAPKPFHGLNRGAALVRFCGCARVTWCPRAFEAEKLGARLPWCCETMSAPRLRMGRVAAGDGAKTVGFRRRFVSWWNEP